MSSQSFQTRLERKEALVAMQSSTTVACRALVMLACLVAIPLAAVFGTSLPDIVRGVLKGRWGPNAASARETLGEAPPFRSTAEAAPPGGNGEGSMPTDGLTGGQNAARGWPLQPVRSADPSAPKPPAAPDDLPIEPFPDRADSYDLVPVAVSTPPTDRFASVQQRLRELGATYYLLESWGSQGQLHRFYCRMAIGGNPSYARHFEATDPDPLGAMAKVLQQVEAWRAVPERLNQSRHSDLSRAPGSA